MERADKYNISVCNNTGTIAARNKKENKYLSVMMNDGLSFHKDEGENKIYLKRGLRKGFDFSDLDIPYAYKLFMQENTFNN